VFPYVDPVTVRDDLLQKLRAAVAGGPYVVEETPQGFDLKVDVVDAQWYTLIRRNGLTKVFTYSVTLHEADKKYSVTDISNEVRWSAGADMDGPPTLVAEAQQQRGRVYEKSFAIETGVDARTHELGTPVNYSFSSGEGRDLIRRVAKESGWSERMGSEQKIGLVVAGTTVALLLIVGLVALVIALIG
jgi:hypothetical protein